MYFEAEVKRKKYKIEVDETKTHWRVVLQQEGEKPEAFEIPKSEYSKFDDAISFIFSGKSYMLDVVPSDTGYTIFRLSSYRNITIHNDESLLHEQLRGTGNLGRSDQLAAGMPGKIVKIMVKPGQRVAAGGAILVMEAMKMENEIRAAHDCVVKEILVTEGTSVDTGAVLVSFEAN